MSTETWVLRDDLPETLDLFRPLAGSEKGGGWFHTRKCHIQRLQGTTLDNPWWALDLPTRMAEIVQEYNNEHPDQPHPIGLCMKCTARPQ